MGNGTPLGYNGYIMCMACSIAYGAVGVSLALASTGIPGAATFINKPSVDTSEITITKELAAALSEIKVPVVKEPGWLVQQKIAEAAAQAQRKAVTRTVTYDVATKGVITANVVEFRSQANATLNDARGWARLGANFQEVASGGMFTLVLSEASQMTSFSSGCGTEYSCRAGRFVIINQDRWLGATPSWNQAGGSLRDYRHMVINHETGHWLGHDHAQCPGPGQPAMVMQQQSISLQGCTFNPWPTTAELWSTQLGIKL